MIHDHANPPAVRPALPGCILLVLAFCAWPGDVACGQCIDAHGQELIAADGVRLDAFGYAVSISGDALIVGAVRDRDRGLWTGAAYVYRLEESTWVEEQKLTASDAIQEDAFGCAVAIDGDVAVVGARWNDDAGMSSGSAYVFRFDGNVWAEEQKLLASDGTAFDEFGESVSVSGDVVVVGAHFDGDAGERAGSAYVYRFDGNAWIEEQKLVAGDAAASDQFGESVSVSGDVVVVGAPRGDGAAVDTGAAYVFRFDGSAWSDEQKLSAGAGEWRDEFGWSVAVSGNVAVAGTPLDGVADNTSSGSATVYRFDGSAWTEEQTLVASDPAVAGWLGKSVALHGDVIVAGAPFDNGTEYHSGAAYVYRHNGIRWVEQRKLKPWDSDDHNEFGGSVSVHDDRVLGGAERGEGRARDSGSAYVFPVPDIECKIGTVDLGSNPNAASVLTINGNAGVCNDVDVRVGSPIEIFMDAPPAGPSPAPFVLYVWTGEPDESTVSPQPANLGLMCLPTFLTVGTRKPFKVWNNAGHGRWLGQPDFSSQPAPSTVLSAGAGWDRPVTLTLQGYIFDHGSAADVRASVTNAVVLRVFR